MKKALMGLRMTSSKLRRLIKTVVIIPSTNAWDSREILPKEFCPKCGCDWVMFVDHGVEYPERWVSGYCARCGNHVVESDNSPFYHALECADNNYEI